MHQLSSTHLIDGLRAYWSVVLTTMDQGTAAAEYYGDADTAPTWGRR